MGRRPEARKFGVPLYCAAWPPGDTVLVAGGGGKKSSGIPNRIVLSQHKDGRLSEETGSITTQDAPLRMAITSKGNFLVLALGKGGLERFDVDQSTKHVLNVSPSPGDAQKALQSLGMIKALAFNRDGRYLALGGEDGSIVVLDWPSAHISAALRGDKALKDAVRDVDFSTLHHDRVVATTCEDGTCILWEWGRGIQVAALELPQELKHGSFNRCRFARDGRPALFTAVNCRGEGFLLAWEQTADGEMALQRRVRAHKAAITAFDISTSGAYLGTGTSEGDVGIFAAARLTPLRRIAGSHMVFVTAVAWAPDESALLSVSADASASVALVARPSKITPLALALVLFVILLAVILQRWLAAGALAGSGARLDVQQEL